LEKPTTTGVPASILKDKETAIYYTSGSSVSLK
jgi:hypothetical protein